MQAIQNLTGNFQSLTEQDRQTVLERPTIQPTFQTQTMHELSIVQPTAPALPTQTASNIDLSSFWVVMTEMFGSQWVNEYGDVPNATWRSELQQLTAAEIENGIKQCKRSRSGFVPRLPKFLDWCQPPMVKVEDFYKPERETQKYLERRRSTANASEEVKNQALAEMKNLLKFKPQPQGEMR